MEAEDEDLLSALPARVGRVFMMDDGFFSPFMRDKIPKMLFSNGSAGFEALSRPTTPLRAPELLRSASPAVIRNVPIQLNEENRRLDRRTPSPSSFISDDTDRRFFYSEKRNMSPFEESQMSPTLKETKLQTEEKPNRKISESRKISFSDLAETSSKQIPFFGELWRSESRHSFSDSTNERKIAERIKEEKTERRNPQKLPPLTDKSRNDHWFEAKSDVPPTPPTPDYHNSPTLPTISFLRRTQTMTPPPLPPPPPQLPPRPHSRQSLAESRKSPAILRRGAGLITQCVRKPKEEEEIYERKPNRTQSTPSLLEKSHLSLDPVEEAIKSLESFDPSEYIRKENSRSFSQQNLNNNWTDGTLRKRTLRSEITDSVQTIEQLSNRISRITANPKWREYFILSQNLKSIKESVYSVHQALRNILQTSNQWEQTEELKRLISPLRSADALIGRLLKTLEFSGWSVDLLSRNSERNVAPDALDQFVAILAHLPRDCSKVANWLLEPQEKTLSSFEFRNGTERMDGGESTTSSNSSEQTAITNHSDIRSETITPKVIDNDDETNSIVSQTVMEEDDLISVIESEPSSPQPNEAAERNDERRVLRIQKLRRERELSEEERDFLQFCCPQIDQHTEMLSKVIEEFFSTIAEGQHPTKFERKIRMMTMEGQILVHLSTNVAQHLSHPTLRKEFNDAANQLDSAIIECERTATIARKEHPSVPAIKTMVYSVIQISKQSQNLRLLTKTCTYGTA